MWRHWWDSLPTVQNKTMFNLFVNWVREATSTTCIIRTTQILMTNTTQLLVFSHFNDLNVSPMACYPRIRFSTGICFRLCPCCATPQKEQIWGLGLVFQAFYFPYLLLFVRCTYLCHVNLFCLLWNPWPWWISLSLDTQVSYCSPSIAADLVELLVPITKGHNCVWIQGQATINWTVE